MVRLPLAATSSARAGFRGTTAAAHHRLTWIHPFLDGNGRVARLFTQAWLVQAGVDSDGLWTISRGLARQKAEYQIALANADEQRVTDFNGRGYLSQRYLGEFCDFFLGTAADQVEFMENLLALEGMLRRILGYGERRESAKELPGGSALVLRDVFLRGEIARGEVSRIIGASPQNRSKGHRRIAGPAVNHFRIAKRSAESGISVGCRRALLPEPVPGRLGLTECLRTENGCRGWIRTNIAAFKGRCPTH